MSSRLGADRDFIKARRILCSVKRRAKLLYTWKTPFKSSAVKPRRLDFGLSKKESVNLPDSHQNPRQKLDRSEMRQLSVSQRLHFMAYFVEVAQATSTRISRSQPLHSYFCRATMQDSAGMLRICCAHEVPSPRRWASKVSGRDRADASRKGDCRSEEEVKIGETRPSRGLRNHTIHGLLSSCKLHLLARIAFVWRYEIWLIPCFSYLLPCSKLQL